MALMLEKALYRYCDRCGGLFSTIPTVVQDPDTFAFSEVIETSCLDCRSRGFITDYKASCDFCGAGAKEPCYPMCPGSTSYWAAKAERTARIATELASIKQGLDDIIERCNKHLRSA